jgi:hypothetical protein
MNGLPFLRDGNLDLAAAVTLGDGVALFFRIGDGSFRTTVNDQAGNNPRSIFCADLDQDVDHD